MASDEDLDLSYLFSESSSDGDDVKIRSKLSKKVKIKSVRKSSDKTTEKTPSSEEDKNTSGKENVLSADEDITDKLRPEEIEKRNDFYKDYLDLTSLLTHMPTYKAVAPRIISLIVSDLQSKRLRRTTKDEVLSAALSNGLKCQHLTRRRFATYDLLLPTKEDCEALARKVLVHEQLRIQTEYRGRRLLKVTLCKTPSRIKEDHVSSFFQQYGEVVSIASRVSRIGFPYLEWDVQLYIDREGFDSIPELFTEQGLRLPVIVEGRRPLCWNCSRMGHLSADCLNKKPVTTTNTKWTPPQTQTRNNRNVYRSRPTTRQSTNAPVSNRKDSVGSSGSFEADTTPKAQPKPMRNRTRRPRRRGQQRTSISSE